MPPEASMTDPIRPSAAAFQERVPGGLIKEHYARSSNDVFVQLLSRRRHQESIVIPAVPEPLLVWVTSGVAMVEERQAGGKWQANRVEAGDFFLTTAETPSELRWTAEGRPPFEVMHIYIGQQLLKRAIRAVLGRQDPGFGLREISGERDANLSSLLEHVKREMTEQDEPSREYIYGLAQAMTIHLARSYQTTTSTNKAFRGGLQAYKLHRVFDAMKKRLQHPFMLNEYSKLAGLSEYHFSRVFKQSTGESPSSYFIRLRIEHAKDLLINSESKIVDVCLSIGYASPSHFSALFRAATDVSPSEYRELYRENSSANSDMNAPRRGIDQ
jgi:AraC family transcriptional regulator